MPPARRRGLGFKAENSGGKEEEEEILHLGYITPLVWGDGERGRGGESLAYIIRGQKGPFGKYSQGLYQDLKHYEICKPIAP